MSEIGIDQLPGLIVSYGQATKLKVGQLLTASVAGPTRHGLAVTFGQQTYTLNAPSLPPDAKTLTLEIKGAAPSGGYRVDVVAGDDQALDQPIVGRLAGRLQTEAGRTAPAPAVRDHFIEVSAQRLGADGKAVGESVVVRLATQAGTEKGARIQNSQGPAPLVAGRVRPLIPAGPSNLAAPTKEPTFRMPAASVIPSNVKVSGNKFASAALNHRDSGLPNQVPAVSETTRAPEPLRAGPMPTNQAILPRNDHPQVTAATVIGKSPSGQLIVATNGLQLKIEQSIDLPVGAELQLTFVTVSVGLFGATNAETVSHRPNPLTVLVEILEDIDNAGRRPVDVEQPAADRPRSLPMPDRNLAAKLLELFALSVESDLGDGQLSTRDDPHASRQAKERLQTAVIELARSTTEPLADDWQGLKLPIGSDSNQAVCIFHRDHHQEQDGKGDDSHDEAPEVQRALFEVNFSSLGRCQIDALCQHDRFDLLVRSEHALREKAKEEITEIYDSACQISGFKGEIGFRVGQFFEPPKVTMTTQSVVT